MQILKAEWKFCFRERERDFVLEIEMVLLQSNHEDENRTIPTIQMFNQTWVKQTKLLTNHSTAELKRITKAIAYILQDSRKGKWGINETCCKLMYLCLKWLIDPRKIFNFKRKKEVLKSTRLRKKGNK